MRIAGIPSTLVHVDPPLETQFEMLLCRSDIDSLAKRLVFVTARDINDHIASGKPALRCTVGICIRDLPETHVAPDIDVPSVEVRIDLIVMTVRLVRHAVRRSEVDAARDDLSSLVVNYSYFHPVLSGFGK